jgi:aspartate/methionine/tyrosine aminotransferase
VAGEAGEVPENIALGKIEIRTGFGVTFEPKYRTCPDSSAIAEGGPSPVTFTLNPLLLATPHPPIPEIQGWAVESPHRGGLPVIDVVQAVPGYPPHPDLAAYLAEKVREFRLSLYTPIQGLPGLRNAFAGELNAAYQASVGADQLCITAGCNQAYYIAMIALARAGDNVILPAPYYFNHRMTLDMLGIEARLLPAREENGFIPDPEEAEPLVNDRTRALVLVTPSNPTGAVCNPEHLRRFFDLAQRRRIALVLDETYRDFLPASMPRAHDLFLEPGWEGTLIHLYSFSKVYSLAGYRVGAVVAESRFIAQIMKIMDCLAICAPHISQLAAQYGIEHLGEWRAEKRALMAGRVGAFRNAVESRAPAWSIGSIGAYFAYLRHPWSGRAAGAVARGLAREQNLLCLPGTVFGPGQEAYLRFAFANVAADRMDEIARRLGDLSAL